MHLVWKAKRYKIYSGKHLFWRYYLQLYFVYKTMSQISFKLFCSGDKRLLSEFLKKLGWFQGHDERFPKYLEWKLKFQKNWETFVDERALIATTLMFSCHWKTLVTFCLREKRPEKAFLILIVSYRKIIHKNKLFHLKQQ